MITCLRLGKQGNLGNQLFQYAVLHGIAARHGYEVAIPPLGRHQLGQVFDIPDRILTNAELRRLRAVLVEPTFAFAPEVLDAADGSSVVGYFQSERYFAHVAATVDDHLRFRRDVADAADRRMAEIRERARTIVGLSVRRGDYVELDQVYTQVWRSSFYTDALARFRADGDTAFAVCSDDPAWCQEHLTGEDVVVCADLPWPAQLAVLASCDHSVIANSTFSWWGAWLAERRQGGAVVAPDPWFRSPGLPSSDLLPQRWERVVVDDALTGTRPAP